MAAETASVKKEDKKMAEDLKKEVKKTGEANAKDTQAMFYIYIYDPISETAKMEKFVTLGSDRNIRGKTLSDIRGMLISEKALTFRQQGSVFCNAIGAEAKESTSFDLYIQSLSAQVETGDKEKPATEQRVDDAPGSGQTSTMKPGADYVSYKIYLKSRKLPTDLDDTTKEFLKQKMELDLKKRELLSAKPEQLTSSYNHQYFMATSSGGSVVHPADMTERHWHIVFQTNSLLNGSQVRRPKAGVARKVERAMYPAFKLKARLFHDYEVMFEGNGIRPQTQTLRIPLFTVEDDSYVEVTEKKKSVARAIAASSLSEVAAEVAVGAGAFGYSAGAKASFKNEESESSASSEQDDTKQMTITYNFPRVVLQLDENSLELSEECKKRLDDVTDKDFLEKFNNEYGHFFATRVELGGRLHSSEDSEAIGEASASEKAKAMKAAASLSFSSPYVQASASASYGSSTQNKDDKKSSSLNVSMTWEAKGGDTLLCNNPPAWCSTVASFYNWRVVKQENLVSIEDMISRIPGHQNVKAKFENIRNDSKKLPPKETRVQLTLQLKEATSGRLVTAEENGKDEYKIMGCIASAANWGKDATPAQKDWFDISNLKEIYAGCNPFYMAASKGTGQQSFKVNGPGVSIDGKQRLKYGEPYKLYCDYAKKWLQASEVCPGYYTKSFLLTAKEERAGTFHFRPAKSFEGLHIINEGDEVIIDMYDRKGRLVGPLQEIEDKLLGAHLESDAWKFKFLYT